MRNFFSIFALSNVVIASVFSMSNDWVGMDPNEIKKIIQMSKAEKSKHLPLHREVQQLDGTVWRFSLDSTKATFMKKKNDEYFKCPVTHFENFATSNGFKDARFLGLTLLVPNKVMAVLLASKNQQDDTCIFAQFSPETQIHSLSRVISSLKITEVKVTNESTEDAIGLYLYQEDLKKGFKTRIVFDVTKGLRIVEETLKIWDLKK